ncbi:MAG: DNA alkylation repair protein [bacterium]|nr:DNA alkylation repair protein [bacterium]
MTDHARPADAVARIHALHARLDALSTETSRDFWTRTMKGVVPFRGVPMAGIRRAVHAWWRHDGPATLAPADRKTLALALFEGDFGEDKLAGTLVLREILLEELANPDLEELGALFDRGLIADWNTCDWFCLKVLGGMVERDLPAREVAGAIAAWRDAPSLWQRRAANVAFVNLAKHGEQNFEGFTKLMLETCAVTVQSAERFAQTGVGWLLRELAEAEHAAVMAFLDAHLGLMSREAVRSVTERMPVSVKSPVLEKHRQVRAR